MNNLVFLEPNCIKAVPFTTSKVIAENTGVGHRYIKKQIVTHKSSLETFGLLVAHETESTGGRPEEIISLNEQQSTLLVKFLNRTSSPILRNAHRTSKASNRQIRPKANSKNID